MAKRTRRVFTETFKAEAIRLAKSGDGNLAAVARDLDVHVTTLRDWVLRAQQPQTDSETLSPSEKQELLQLRKDNAVLKMEREILKKAAAFFAKESR
jgi:transposase